MSLALEGVAISAKKPVVLVVDDNDMFRKLLAAELAQDETLQIEQAGSGEEGLAKALSPDCTVVVLDMMLGDMDGLSFVQYLRDKRPDPPSIIVITAAPPVLVPDGIIEAPYRGLVTAVFRKPFDHAKFRETVVFCARG